LDREKKDLKERKRGIQSAGERKHFGQSIYGFALWTRTETYSWDWDEKTKYKKQKGT